MMTERYRIFIAYVTQQLQQASTWRGLILIISGAFGWTLDPERMAAVISIGVMASGAVGLLFPDNLKKPDEPKEPQ